ncbi:uncharacterized protein [Haliotis cracherodii]|uniref:uncharacterized protein n=1 Tax=Haliotis cracherodii TaxID=6455 RepID=UPI0039E77D83
MASLTFACVTVMCLQLTQATSTTTVRSTIPSPAATVTTPSRITTASPTTPDMATSRTTTISTTTSENPAAHSSSTSLIPNNSTQDNTETGGIDDALLITLFLVTVVVIVIVICITAVIITLIRRQRNRNSKENPPEPRYASFVPPDEAEGYRTLDRAVYKNEFLHLEERNTCETEAEPHCDRLEVKMTEDDYTTIDGVAAV